MNKISITLFYLANILILLNINYVEPKSPDWPNVCPDIQTKTQWGGKTAIEVDYAIIPIKNVVVHHTVTGDCNNLEQCSQLLRNIQHFHITTMEFPDIGYNFIIGGDGRVYEGAGWHKVGAHTRGYNTRSIGLAFIGNFSDKKPTTEALKVAKDFLQCAVELGELHPEYRLFGARQVSATLSPGNVLYRELQNWPHFVQTP